jgi:hypothetical protein
MCISSAHFYSGFSIKNLYTFFAYPRHDMPGRTAEVQILNFLYPVLSLHFAPLSSSKYLLETSFSNTPFYSRPLFFSHVSHSTKILLCLLLPPPLQHVWSLFFPSESAVSFQYSHKDRCCCPQLAS